MYVSSNLKTKASTRIIFFSNNSEGSRVPSNPPWKIPPPRKIPTQKIPTCNIPTHFTNGPGRGVREDCSPGRIQPAPLLQTQNFLFDEKMLLINLIN